MQWNGEADIQIIRVLLRFLISKHIPIPYAEIAAEFGVTPKAVMHRLRKLREEPVNSTGENNDGGERNRVAEAAGAGGELAFPLELPTGGKGRRRAEGKKKPSNKVLKGRVGKPEY